MARNKAIALTDTESAHVNVTLSRVRVGEHNMVTYTKRNGETETVYGVTTVIGVPGFDTHSLLIDTVADKGKPTTANLVRVSAVRQ